MIKLKLTEQENKTQVFRGDVGSPQKPLT